jgi:hypothetical protein
MQVPYRRNRGIFYDGNLPHLSTPVTRIGSETAAAATAASSGHDSSNGSGSDTASAPAPARVSAGAGASASREGRRRVVLGLNCFSHTVDECCRRAPEHSGKNHDNY